MIDSNEMDAAVEAAKIAVVEHLLALTGIMIPSEEFLLGHTSCKIVEEATKNYIKPIITK